jgi:hypothetical protein
MEERFAQTGILSPVSLISTPCPHISGNRHIHHAQKPIFLKEAEVIRMINISRPFVSAFSEY